MLSRSASIAFITLGCAKNEVDSDKMRARVLHAGFEVVADAAAADAVIVNTCSFITEATEEAISTILEALDLPRVAAGEARLVVTGCLPARYGASLAEELPEVAAFVTCADEEHIVEVLNDLLGGQGDRMGQGDGASAPFASASVPFVPSPCPPVRRTISAPWAYVKIADGCDRRCSFCTIPRIRGHYHSVPADEIVAEVAELVSGGVREVVLIAQDTGLWGHDLPSTRDIRSHDLLSARHSGLVPESKRGAADDDGWRSDPSCPPPHNLAELLELLATRFPSTWLRVMYLQPSGITSELLATMARHANICNYLDLPLQHANARVLREMNRSGSGPEYLALLARIRAALPDVTLRTTVIAGFPGETRAEARELERFIEQAAFDYVGVFPYSQEEGTAAGSRVDQVPPRTRRARAQRLRDLADAIGFAKVAARVGTVEEVLVIECDEDAEDDVYPLLGRTKGQAPEVDGMVHLNKGNIGNLVSVTMVESYCYELDGRVTGADYD